MAEERSTEDSRVHEPVMVKEVLKYLRPEQKESGTFVDATVSTGGHAKAIAENLGPLGVLVGLDLDMKALRIAKQRLSETEPEVKLFQTNFVNIEDLLREENLNKADGILFDLGFSSFQLGDSGRGFSFQKEGPLDMRMNSERGVTAEEIINQYSFEKIKEIILRFGEERWADGIASEIVNRRDEKKITSTQQLVNLIEDVLPEAVKQQRNIHPATKTFQGLRIAVNDELNNLDKGLSSAFECLQKGGVVVFISYHSLEDRKVKRFFTHKARNCICPPDLPICRCSKEVELEILASGIRPSKDEIEKNPRARSGRLRAAKRI